jgi:3,5-epimerase/4-reductase
MAITLKPLSEMKSKILILGKGFIGDRLQEALGAASSGAMVYNFSDAQACVRRFSPKIIINCIGITGKNNVDDCEAVKDDALLANSFVPIILAEVALRNKIKLVHISSGCIFHYDYSKDSPINEEVVPDYFELFYSRTKIYAERALDVLAKKYPILIARIRVPLDFRSHPKNILEKLIRYKKVIDIPNSVTYIPDFIRALQHLLRIDARGIYNIVNKGTLRYPELLEVYKRYVPDFKYRVIKLNELKLTRTNLILSTRKLERTGFKTRRIEDVYDECVRKYLEDSKGRR